MCTSYDSACITCNSSYSNVPQRLFVLSGVPAISVPVGLCCKGLPLGVQVIGRWMDERTMIKVARAIELICHKGALL